MFPYWLLLFYFTTTLGSIFSSIAIFLEIEPTFQKVFLLSLALAIRTFAMMLFSYHSSKIFRFFGIKRTFLFAQILGILALVFIFWGFKIFFFPLVIFSIILSGIPANLVNVGLIATLRATIQSSSQFRKFSGAREILLGCSQMIGGITVPFILIKKGLSAILIIDLISYLLAIVIVFQIPKSQWPEDPIQPQEKTNCLLLKNQEFLQFAVLTGIPLLFIGLLPLLASSTKLNIIQHFPETIRKSLWTIEGITTILAGFLYLSTQKLLRNPFVKNFILLNSFWLLVLLLPTHFVIHMIVLLLISISWILGFLKLRDDLLLSIKSQPSLINTYTGLATAFRLVMGTISPFVLGWVFVQFSLKQSIAFTMAYQGILLSLSLFYFSKKRVSDTDVVESS